jgi:phosphatidylserine/phosphatidylglycerophosphate/cardiolipin synthase-like enzyme
VNSLDIGIDVAIAEVAFELACLDDLSLEVLAVAAECLSGSQAQPPTPDTVSERQLGAALGDRLTGERVRTLMYALIQAGVLNRQHRDRRGAEFDAYSVDKARLQILLHDVDVARYVLRRAAQTSVQPTDITLLATVPASLQVGPGVTRGTISVSVALHRLITDATTEVIILNPFFEQEGFDRLASALLAAARKGVNVVVITRALTKWPPRQKRAPVNRIVLGELAAQVIQEGLEDRFRMYQYQRLEGDWLAVTFHAKALVADGVSAYLGSANLTEYGMARYLEMGTLVSGAMARQIKQILQAVLASPDAEQVPLDVLVDARKSHARSWSQPTQ